MQCQAARSALWPEPPSPPAPPELEEALAHYGGCAACQAFFRRERALAARLRRLRATVVPDTTRARLERALAAERGRRRKRQWLVAGGGAAVVAAAAALVLLISPPPMPEAATRPLVVEASAGLLDDAMVSGELSHVEQWLGQQVGYAVELPEIDEAVVVGGRVAVVGGTPIPVAFYLLRGTPISYFALPTGDVMGAPVPGTDVVTVSSDGYEVAVWSERGFARALVAPLPRREMVAIAKECKRKALML